MRPLHWIALVIISLFCQHYLLAQQNREVPVYKASIYFNEGVSPTSGVLYQLKDSSITFSDSYIIEDYYINNFRVTDYPIPGIKMIDVKVKNQGLKNMAIGGAIGITFGAILGYTGGDDVHKPGELGLFNFTAEEKARAGAVVFGTIGALAGAIGFNSVTIKLNGDMDRYNKHRTRLQKYSLENNTRRSTSKKNRPNDSMNLLKRRI